MLFWVFVILILDLLLIGSLVWCTVPFYINALAYAILLVAIGILYRVYVKTKGARFESTKEELQRLRIENREMREQLAQLKPDKEE